MGFALSPYPGLVFTERETETGKEQELQGEADKGWTDS